MSFDDTALLGEARQWLRGCVEEGAQCPCCTQLAKVYRRKINSGQARGLMTMFKAAGREWVHIPSTEHLSRLGGELARLRYWGLVEERDRKRDDGGRAGEWRVTSKGEDFLRGGISVAKYARLYDSKLLSLDPVETVTIIDALGDKFSYFDLMAGL